MLFDKIGDVKIISKATQEEESIIAFAHIEFNKYIDSYFMNNDADIITIKLEDKFIITLDDIQIEKVNFNYDNIKNIRPYKFDFVTIINGLPYKGIIDDAYINNRYEPLNKGMSKLNLETRADSKLILTKIETE